MKKKWFLCEEGEVLDDKPAKWSIAKKTYQNIHPQLTHMTLQEGMVIKSIIKLSIK
jgi:hypothetical protein